MISSFWESLGSPSNLVAKKACDHDHGDMGTGLAKRAAQTHLSVAQNKVKVGFWSLLMLVFLVSLQALCKSFRLCYEIMVKSKKWWGYQWFGDKNKLNSVSLSLSLPMELESMRRGELIWTEGEEEGGVEITNMTLCFWMKGLYNDCFTLLFLIWCDFFF